MKRVWKVKTWESVSNPRNAIDTCAICRGLIHLECIECNAQTTPRAQPLRWCRNTLMTLMCCRNRESSPLRLLDVHIISLIFGFCIEKVECKTMCFIAQTGCGHMYHAHCFERWLRWLRKRQICPLCGTDYNEETTIVSHRRIEWNTKHNVEILPDE